MPSFDVQTTPNPNSMKITTDAGRFTENGMVAFASAEEAADHPLGRRLFTIEGVDNVLILPDFVTITKTPPASWNDLLPAVEDVLAAHFDSQ